MANNVEWLTKHVFTIYKRNSYVNLLGMNLVKLDEGYAELSMPIMDKHTNLYHVAHGGAIASLADTCMGVACATTGKKVVTLEMNMNFIKSAVPQSKLRGIGKIIHNGKSTIVAEGQILDGQDNMIATARGTFYVTGIFEDIEEE